MAGRLSNLAAVIAVLCFTAPPAIAYNRYAGMNTPSVVAPTSAEECKRLQDRWSGVLREVDEAHSECLEVHSGDHNDSGDTCSRSPCQRLHDRLFGHPEKMSRSVRQCYDAVALYERFRNSSERALRQPSREDRHVRGSNNLRPAVARETMVTRELPENPILRVSAVLSEQKAHLDKMATALRSATDQRARTAGKVAAALSDLAALLSRWSEAGSQGNPPAVVSETLILINNLNPNAASRVKVRQALEDIDVIFRDAMSLVEGEFAALETGVPQDPEEKPLRINRMPFSGLPPSGDCIVFSGKTVCK